jgi:hypothetical protein
MVGMKNKNLKIRNLTLFSSIMALVYFLVISSSQTKLPWYVVPAYPFLALLVGVFIHHIFSLIKEKVNLKNRILPFVFLCFIFMAPYGLIIGKIYHQKQRIWKKELYGISYYLRDIHQKKIENDNFTILYDDIFTHGKFYLNLLQKQGKNISLKNSRDNIENGEIVLISQNAVKEFLEENYEIEILEEFYIHGLYKVVDKKYY